MARQRSEPGASTATLDISWMAAAGVAVLAPVFGLVAGLYLALKQTIVYVSRYESDGVTIYRDSFVKQHTTLGVGLTVIVFGLLVGVLAWVVAISVHHQVAPRIAAQRRAAAQAVADEQT